MYKHPLIDRDKITPTAALDYLIEGNQRFTNNISSNKDLLQVANITKDQQHPLAAILSCSDSRTSTELIFDQNLGDIFSVRLAGNIASNKAIGSLEYACQYLGAKVVVVLGHTKCGAVKAACDHFSGGHIGEITSLIKHAVDGEKECREHRHSGNPEFVDRVCELNIALQMVRILHGSEMLLNMLREQRIGLVGGMYDLETAMVAFPDQYRWFNLPDALKQVAFDDLMRISAGGVLHAAA